MFRAIKKAILTVYKTAGLFLFDKIILPLFAMWSLKACVEYLDKTWIGTPEQKIGFFKGENQDDEIMQHLERCIPHFKEFYPYYVKEFNRRFPMPATYYLYFSPHPAHVPTGEPNG